MAGGIATDSQKFTLERPAHSEVMLENCVCEYWASRTYCKRIAGFWSQRE